MALTAAQMEEAQHVINSGLAECRFDIQDLDNESLTDAITGGLHSDDPEKDDFLALAILGSMLVEWHRRTGCTGH